MLAQAGEKEGPEYETEQEAQAAGLSLPPSLSLPPPLSLSL